MTDQSHKGLVKRKVTVKRGGKTFQRYQWVKSGEDQPSSKKSEKKDSLGEFSIGDDLIMVGKKVTIEKIDESQKTIKFSDGKVYTLAAVKKFGKFVTSEKPKEIKIKDLKIDKNPKDKSPKTDKVISKTSNIMKPENVKSFKNLNDMNIEGGMNEDYTQIITFKDKSKAIYKTSSYIDAQGESNFKKLESVLGFDNAPDLVVGDFGRGRGSVQKWVENIVDYVPRKFSDKQIDDLSKIYIMDMIVGNYDRHEDNIKFDKDGKFWAIDNDTWGTKSTTELNVKSGGDIGKMGEWFHPTDEDMNKFQLHIDKNIKVVIDHKDEIIKYIKDLNTDSKKMNQLYDDKYVGFDLTGSNLPRNIKESTDNMLTNISKILKYNENLGD